MDQVSINHITSDSNLTNGQLHTVDMARVTAIEDELKRTLDALEIQCVLDFSKRSGWVCRSPPAHAHTRAFSSCSL